MYRIYRKILNSEWEISKSDEKWYVLKEIFGIISGSLPEDQGGFTCMQTCWLDCADAPLLFAYVNNIFHDMAHFIPFPSSEPVLGFESPAPWLSVAKLTGFLINICSFPSLLEDHAKLSLTVSASEISTPKYAFSYIVEKVLFFLKHSLFLSYYTESTKKRCPCWCSVVLRSCLFGFNNASNNFSVIFKSWMPSEEQLVPFLTALVCCGPGSIPFPEADILPTELLGPVC